MKSPNLLKGRRIVCGEVNKTHYEQEEYAMFQFVDYSWECNACGGIHCSQCFYESDGDTITVYDCGRFFDTPKFTGKRSGMSLCSENLGQS